MLAIIIIGALFCCCNETEVKINEASSNDSTTYFQLADYIKSQVKDVNNTPYFIYKITIEGDKKDSTPITNVETVELSRHFTEPDLNDRTIKKYFKESVFFDETTKNYSVSYSTTNKDIVLQNVDVLLKEDGKSVKRIFLRKLYNYTDSSIIEQLNWKPNEGFQINRLVQFPSKKEISRQTLVAWNTKGQ